MANSVFLMLSLPALWVLCTDEASLSGKNITNKLLEVHDHSNVIVTVCHFCFPTQNWNSLVYKYVTVIEQNTCTSWYQKYSILRSNFGVSILVKNSDLVVCVCFALVNLLLWLLCWLVLINICSTFHFVESLENRTEKKIDALRIKYFKNQNYSSNDHFS